MKKLIIFALTSMLVLASGCSSSSSSDSASTKASAESSKTSEETQVFSDDMIDVFYYNMFDNYEQSAGIKVKVVNKTDKHITVFPTNSYMNDTAVTLTTGVFTEMDAGKNAMTAFVFFYKQAGIEKLDEVKTVTTQLLVQDENSADLETTPVITFTK